jgi:hypothetical protein
VLGYVIGKGSRKDLDPSNKLAIPPDLRRRLAPWVNVDEVGAEGFWLWLRAILPLLPSPDSSAKGVILVGGPRLEEVRELQQRFVVYARELSRLTVIGDQYARDNLALTRRLKALEAALRTLGMAGHAIEIPEDEEARDASYRYLHSRRKRSVAVDPGAR